MRTLPALFAALAIAAVVACSAGKPVAHTASPPPPLSDLHAQIAELDATLAADRDRLGVEAPSVDEVTAAHAMAAGTSATDTCAPSSSQTCTDVCTLSDSICGNATKICDLSRELPGDAWAAERCDAGKATCAKATARCCDCR